MKKLFCYIFLLLLFADTMAQTIHSPVKSGNEEPCLYHKQWMPVFSFLSNPATLCEIKQAGIAIHEERRFLLKALNFSAFALAIPYGNGGIGLSITYFGFGTYREWQAGITYAKKLGDKVNLGLRFNYYSLDIAGYGHAATLNADIGAVFHPTDKISMALHVYNPAGGKFGKNTHEKLASEYTIGLGYEMSEQVLWSLEMIKEENRPFGIRAALQYVYSKQLFIKAGITTAPVMPFGGIGLRWKNFRLMVSGSYHLRLGFNPSMELDCYFKNAKEQ